MNVAVIPARGGSTRIPGKNIKDFHGRPIIGYSITTALESKLFNKVIVSTDSEAIADVARKEGAEVPFVRPKELSDNMVPLAPVIKHTLLWLKRNSDFSIKYVCCITATAPFLRVGDLKNGVEVISKRNVSSVFSITSFPFPIFRALKICDDGHLKMFWPENELVRSQDLPEAYHDAGQFYWLDINKFLENNKIYTHDALPVILPRCLVQDIDTPEDWNTAEVMYEAFLKNRKKSYETGN